MNENIIIAAIGGAVYNVVPLLELWKTPKQSRPDFGELLYWLPFLVWPILAGFLLFLYDGPEVKFTKLLAFNVGISAPLAIRKMIDILPILPPQVKLKDQNQ